MTLPGIFSLPQRGFAVRSEQKVDGRPALRFFFALSSWDQSSVVDSNQEPLTHRRYRDHRGRTKKSKLTHQQKVKVIDTSKENLYRVFSVQKLIPLECFRFLKQVQSQQKGKLKMVLKGGEPKKKPKKKAAPKKAAKKKAAKKR